MTDQEKEKKEQQSEEEQKETPQEDKSNDPHRGTTDTPSQHKALDPEGERNNDDEYYDEDGALDEELEDLDDLTEEET